MSFQAPMSGHDERDKVSYAVTDYASVEELSSLLRGYDVVLSFVAPYLDQSEAVLAQKHLIDASIRAGVTRFAPSEWVSYVNTDFASVSANEGCSARFDHLSWYSFKAETRQYLEDINKDSKVLEYCLFQPGLFANYLTQPYRSATHVTSIETPWDFQNRRMIMCDGGEDQIITLTNVRDLANVVALAIDYKGYWPVVGGMKGSDLSMKQLISLGEELRGGTSSCFATDRHMC